MKAIKCSNCNKELVEIDDQYALKDKAPTKSVVQCCYCGDKSFKFDFYERSKIRGISKVEIMDQLFDTADIKNLDSNMTLQYKSNEITKVTDFIGMSKDKDGTWILKTQKS